MKTLFSFRAFLLLALLSLLGCGSPAPPEESKVPAQHGGNRKGTAETSYQDESDELVENKEDDENEDLADSGEALDSNDPKEAKVTPLPRFMTAEDMERLVEDRKEAIARDSPFGEEHDAVKELRERNPHNR